MLLFLVRQFLLSLRLHLRVLFLLLLHYLCIGTLLISCGRKQTVAVPSLVLVFSIFDCLSPRVCERVVSFVLTNMLKFFDKCLVSRYRSSFRLNVGCSKVFLFLLSYKVLEAVCVFRLKEISNLTTYFCSFSANQWYAL